MNTDKVNDLLDLAQEKSKHLIHADLFDFETEYHIDSFLVKVLPTVGSYLYLKSQDGLRAIGVYEIIRIDYRWKRFEGKLSQRMDFLIDGNSDDLSPEIWVKKVK